MQTRTVSYRTRPEIYPLPTQLLRNTVVLEGNTPPLHTVNAYFIVLGGTNKAWCIFKDCIKDVKPLGNVFLF